MNHDMNYVVGVDVGSTLLKCQIFDKFGNVKSKSAKEIEVSMPASGYLELDPKQLWSDFQQVFKSCLESDNLTLADIKAMGISVQRNSFLLWERKTSKPLTPIISWQDTRSAESVKSWNKSWKLKIINGTSKLAYLISGNIRYLAASILNFKSSLVSIRLYDLFKTNPDLENRARLGEICYGCIETWLLWCLTDGKEFSTDMSCASVTGIFDPFTSTWSDMLIRLLNLPKQILPDVKNTVDHFGYTSTSFLGQNVSVPIRCIIGDSQAATIGIGCLHKGDGKVTLGTGSFLNINTGDMPHVSMKGLYPEIGYTLKNKSTFLVEGYHPSTGSTIKWLKKLGFFQTYDELESLLDMHSKDDFLDDVYFVPAFMGLHIPVNDPKAAGMLIGLSPTTLRESIVYAVIEAIPMSIRWILDAVQQETGILLKSIRVNGNVAKNKWILQRLADITKLRIEVCNVDEASCNGAAYLAGLGIGLYKSLADINDMCSVLETFMPNNQLTEKLEIKFQKWKQACERSRDWKS